MKTTIEFLNLSIHSSSYRMLEQHVDYWQRLTAITATEVVMERQLQGKPGFRVRVRLAVSGGEVEVEAIARTLKAALHLASHDLESQIQARKAQRVERRAGHDRSAHLPVSKLICEPIVSEGANHASRLAIPLALMQPRPVPEGP